jgi:hypothetical protein
MKRVIKNILFCLAISAFTAAIPAAGVSTLLAMTGIDLLHDGAAAATRILREDKPRMTKQEYLDYQRRLDATAMFHPGIGSDGGGG